MSSVVQSILALAGAAGLQNQAVQDLEQVRHNMQTRIEQLFGDGRSEKSKINQLQKETRKAVEVRPAETLPAARKDDGKPVKVKPPFRYISHLQ